MAHGNSPTRLSVLAPYVPSSQEIETLVEQAKISLRLVLAEVSFKWDREKSAKWGSELIDAIVSESAVRISYKDEEANNRPPRLVMPAALYRKFTVPDQTKAITSHLNLSAYQLEGYSDSLEEKGFKTFDLADITRLTVDRVLDPEDLKSFVERFVLDNDPSALYIAQYQQLRLAHKREQLRKSLG